MTPLLECSGIEKRFFGVPVLRGVSLAVDAGQVVGLVGENGAGKSTLMNILGGNLAPDAGHLHWQGREYRPRHARDARAAGISFVHQELNLFANLSIAENLFLDGFPVSGPFIRRGTLHARAAGLLARVGLDLPPATLVDRLSAGERQLVEIARALASDARLIILDEPTTSLSDRECERLFALVDQLRSDGRALVLISHALGDVQRVCDRVVILRDGEVVGAGPMAEFDQGRLVALMVGRELRQLYPTRSCWAADGAEAPLVREPLLEVRGLTEPGVLRDVSFTMHRGEVLGIAGLMGAGRTELARVLFGLEGHRGGTIRLQGQPVGGPPRQRIRQGLALLTESRRDDGLCLEASIADNMALVTLRQRSATPLGLLPRAGLRAALGAAIRAVQLPADLPVDRAVKTLSGGNQQKVVLAKWLLARPRVLILDEPTRGIDVGAKYEIHRLVHESADGGAGVLVISSEIDELIGVCDRILVMCQGRLTDDIPRPAFDRARILRAALPA